MIREVALSKGFKLKPQPDGSEDLNPYVYEFAEALTEELRREVARARANEREACRQMASMRGF